MKKTVTIPFLVISVVLLLYFAVKWLSSPPGGNRTVEFSVQKGWGGRQIIETLEDSGLVRSAIYTLLRARQLDVLDRFQAGVYDLDTSMTPDSILILMAEGRVKPVPTRWVTLPEGLTLDQTVAILTLNLGFEKNVLDSILSDLVFLRNMNMPVSGGEGYLFPETYEFADTLSPEQVLLIIINTGRSQWQESCLDLCESIGLTSDEVIILASIVEREAMVDSERPRIAKIFLNRLDDGIKLESCATVQYALGEVHEQLLFEDLRIDSPYNTYIYAGLPPGPVCSPGISSIYAVLRPDSTEGELYFVSREDGSGLHLFARTLSEHNANIRRVRSGL